MGAMADAVAEVLPQFEEEHPGFRVKLQKIPWTSSHEKLLTAFAGETLPDVFQLGNTWIPEFDVLGSLEPLNKWLIESECVREVNYFPGIWSANRLNDRVVGIPWYVDTRLLFYRTDVLKKAGFIAPPRTWKEFKELLGRVSEMALEGHYALFAPIEEYELLVIKALQMEAKILHRANTSGGFSSEEFRAAFSFYIDLFDKEYAPKITSSQIPNLAQEFERGYFSFYISGPWNMRFFRERQSLTGKWATAPVPAPDKDAMGGSIAGGSSLVMLRQSKHKKAAWKLIEYLSKPELQVRFYERVGNLPAQIQPWNETPLSKDSLVTAFRTQLDHVTVVPRIPQWERIADLIGKYAEKAIHGQLSIDEALEGLDRDVDVLLERSSQARRQ